MKKLAILYVALIFFTGINGIFSPPLNSLAIAQEDIVQADIVKTPSCPYCGMNREKFASSRIYVEYDDGSTIGTCSVHCAAVDMAVNIDKAPVKIMVGDYNTKALMNAETAVWTIGGNKPGVMTSRAKWAFATKEAAEVYVKTNGGQISNFEEIMAATYADMYQDLKMIRKKRSEMRSKKTHIH